MRTPTADSRWTSLGTLLDACTTAAGWGAKPRSIDPRRRAAVKGRLVEETSRPTIECLRRATAAVGSRCEREVTEARFPGRTACCGGTVPQVPAAEPVRLVDGGVGGGGRVRHTGLAGEKFELHRRPVCGDC